MTAGLPAVIPDYNMGWTNLVKGIALAASNIVTEEWKFE